MLAEFLRVLGDHNQLKQKYERAEEKYERAEEERKRAEKKCEKAEEAFQAQKKRTLAVVAALAGTIRCSQVSNAETVLENSGYDVMNVIVATKADGASEGF